MKLNLRGPLALVAVAAASISIFMTAAALAADEVSFRGKTITMLVGSEPGASTDLSARLMAEFLTKTLPGNPTVIVQNRPGGHGMTVMNFFAQQVAPDGLTVLVASSSQYDPINYRVPQARYKPSAFTIVGGFSLGGSSLIIRNEALKRLTDKAAPPVVMGTLSASLPRSAMALTAWGANYLGWNVRSVSGYGNNGDLSTALERGEIDMAVLGDAWFQIHPQIVDKTKYTLMYQTGANGKRSIIPALADVPMFNEAMKGKISDPMAQEAYNYWSDVIANAKWIALPPKTPESIAGAYRTAFGRSAADRDFVMRGQKIDPSFSVLSSEDLTTTISDLEKASPAALDYVTAILQK